MSLKDKVSRLPKEPGVYMMHNKRGQVIYIGKAKSLRKRVRSYFQKDSHQRFKTKVLVDKIADFEYIVTDTEVEALILENNLIKKHNPKYNIQLKDDKTYPYIKVTTNEEYPRVFKTRVIKNDGARYFGPYTDVRAVNNILDLIHDLFPLRVCKRDVNPKDQSRECLNYHIDKCSGPCINGMEAKNYNQLIEEVLMILEGKEADLKEKLKEKMERASKELEFEKAARYRDQIEAVEKITQKQKVVSKDLVNQDVIALVEDKEMICLQLLIVRNGRLIGKDDFIFNKPRKREEALYSFLQRYYDTAYYVPGEILVDTKLEDKDLLEEWLAKKEEKKVAIKRPKQGEKKELVEMAARNARYSLKEHRVEAKLHGSSLKSGVKSLKKHLGLEVAPYRIAGFDISTIQGSATVGSLVVFENGAPKKSDYRRFRIKQKAGQQDDFAALREVLYRRYSRLLEEDRKLPDLILIDGGKGQLSSACKVLKEIGLEDQPIASLAKREEEIFLPGEKEPVCLPDDADGLYLVQRVRDEAHRFAVSYHRKLRSRRLTQSMLDDIPGVGQKKRQALLQHFGSLNKVRQASVEELEEVPGVGPKLAREIREYLEMNLKHQKGES